MEKSKLIRVLKSLERKEMTRFLELVQSPYFNKHEGVLALATYLEGLYPTFPEDKLPKELVWINLFPKQAYHEQQLSDLMTYLYRLFESFMAIDAYMLQPVQMSSERAANLFEHGLEKELSRELKKQEKQLDKLSFKAPNIYQHRYQLLDKEDKQFAAKGLREYHPALQQKSDALDTNYIIEKLRIACEMANRSNIIQADYQPHLLRELLTYIKNTEELEQNPAIAIYSCIYRSLTEAEQEQHYHQLKTHLTESATLFSRGEAQDFYAYAQNYCIKKINRGKSEYLREIFELFKELIERDLLREGEYLSPWDYKNIVTVGCRIQEYDWTARFIEEQKKTLPPTEMENAYNYNRAAYLYEKGDLRQAMQLLQSVEFTDLYYKLGARSMLLKVYYELREYEALASHTDAFVQFLRRNPQVSEYQYKAHYNLLRFTKKLADIRLSSLSYRKGTLEKEMEKLKAQMAKADDISNAAWLNKQLLDLGENKKAA